MCLLVSWNVKAAVNWHHAQIFWPGTNSVWKGHCLVFRRQSKENHIFCCGCLEKSCQGFALSRLTDVRSTEVAARVNNRSPLSWLWQDAPRWKKPRPPGRRHTSQVPLAAFWMPQTQWEIAACYFQSHTRRRKIWAWQRLRRHVDWSRYWNHGNLWAKASIFIQPRQRCCLPRSLSADVLLRLMPPFLLHAGVRPVNTDSVCSLIWCHVSCVVAFCCFIWRPAAAPFCGRNKRVATPVQYA